ncbi:MAG: MBL fold metallo-hydrolase [Simkaniaceae bacterium]|nr:MBL fold metallo-hydrolase [Simkaniaceae bacterium]
MRGFCPLASGSKGNAIYIGSDETKLLIDAGISVKALKERLNSIGVAIEDLDAVLISHEHSDHIRALPVLCRKYSIPILANSDTARALLEHLTVRPKFKIFTTGESFHFGDIEVHPFSIQHDTLDPVAFTFKMGEMKIGVCTDLGFVTTLVRSHLKECDYLMIESNHEPDLVHASSRPPVYKQRVLSRQGHLSNAACAELIADVYHPGLKQVYLAHLSEECNQPDIALETIRAHLSSRGIDLDLSIAHQHTPSQVLTF